MSPTKRRLREWKAKISGGATTEEIESDSPDPGELWCLQHIATENETSNSSEVRLYVKGRGYEHYIDEQDDPLAGHLFTVDKAVYLYEHEKLVAKWGGTTSGDKLTLYYEGYRQEVKDGS